MEMEKNDLIKMEKSDCVGCDNPEGGSYEQVYTDDGIGPYCEKCIFDLEEAQDIKDAKNALKNIEKHGTISWKSIKKELELDK